MKLTTCLIFALFLVSGCGIAGSDEAPAAAPEAQSPAAKAITAIAETTPTQQDGANDPAIWVNASNPAGSLVLGTSAAGGIEIYDLQGQRVGRMADRPVSLVDVLYQFPLSGNSASLVVAYDTATAELVAYTLDYSAPSLNPVTASPAALNTEAEGLCVYHSPLTGKFYAFAAGGGEIQQWELQGQGGRVAMRHVRTMPVGLGAAHCVVDPESSTLFYSQETVGVWAINAEPESEAEPTAVELAQPFGRIIGDVKGVALVKFSDGGYLLISDADESQFHVYDLENLDHAATFSIASGDRIDGVEETEGMAAVGLTLSASYPTGLLVLADDANEDQHTNYKLVAWQDLADRAGLSAGEAYDPTRSQERTAILVMPSVETDPVTSFGDAADDPAIWVHPKQPELSLVIGTQKQKGMNVYNLEGKLIQSLPDGRLNNVDIRYGFPLDGGRVDIVTASNRTHDSISIYGIDPSSRELYDLADGVISTGMVDPYGLCMYHDAASASYYVIVNDTDGIVRQWLLTDAGNGRVGAQLAREFKLDTQTEGCVADDGTGALYVGEEDIGIWKYSADPGAGDDRVLVDSVADGNLTDDVEGLALYIGPGDKGYLVASNQGADNYAVYERDGDNAFRGLFHVVADDQTGIDGSSETDGLDVSSANLGPAFPNGMLVVQDGRNITPADRQNFKYVPWERIAEALNLEIYSGHDPRSTTRSQ